MTRGEKIAFIRKHFDASMCEVVNETLEKAGFVSFVSKQGAFYGMDLELVIHVTKLTNSMWWIRDNELTVSVYDDLVKKGE